MSMYQSNNFKEFSNIKNFRVDDEEDWKLNIENLRGDNKKIANDLMSTKSSKALKKKFCFKNFKNNACSSLNDVECFLNNFKYYYKYIHLYKFLK